MPDSSLAKKMKRKPEGRAAILNAPAGYEAASFPGLEPAAASLSGQFDWIQLFVGNKAELDRLAPKAARALKSGFHPVDFLPKRFIRDPDRLDPRQRLGYPSDPRFEMDHSDLSGRDLVCVCITSLQIGRSKASIQIIIMSLRATLSTGEGERGNLPLNFEIATVCFATSSQRHKEQNMCRSIKPLRNLDHPVSEQEITEAALQYVRKVSGYRKPSRANEEAFGAAVQEVAQATQKLLESIAARPNLLNYSG
jgi:hypothetical protein